MSSDLLEAFGNTSEQPPPAPSMPSQARIRQTNSFGDFDSFGTTQTEPGNPWQQPSAPGGGPPEEEDDFGDFEDASDTPSTFAPVSKTNQNIHQNTGNFHAVAAQTASWAHLEPKQPDVYSSDWNTSYQVPTNRPAVKQPVPSQTDTISRAKLDRIAPDPDVLFDAGQAVDDDDFGDFEGDLKPSEPARVTHPNATTDLLGLQDDFGSLSMDGHDQHPSPFTNLPPPFQEKRQGTPPGPSKDITIRSKPVKKSPAASFAVSKNSSKKPPPASHKSAEDSWDEFADWEPTAPPPVAPTSKPKSPVVDIASTIKSPLGNEPSTDSLPPTNVPPPAVLLSLFPPLFADAHEKLFKPLAAQPFQLKNRILSDPAVAAFLKGYLLLAVVAARVIAGRKYRWKRDAHLSQGMRIGPASSRGTSGMKLTGVDKGEVSKEDRESLDVVQAWREQVGRLRSAVAGVNSIQPSSVLGAVPDLQETMPVRIAKANEGAATAPQPCALCGLKRNERIGKVDGEVDDSFGEWWIEKSSMHRACRNFWEEHHATLRQR